MSPSPHRDTSKALHEVQPGQPTIQAADSAASNEPLTQSEATGVDHRAYTEYEMVSLPVFVAENTR